MYKKVTDSALAGALKALEGSFGKDFAEKGLHASEYKAIPTGHDDLDAVLTRENPGLFLGGVCEIFGSEGSGKCVTRDTMCLTPHGFMTVEEIFESQGQKCDSSRGFIDVEIELCNRQGKFETTSHFYKNGIGSNLKTICIETKDGFMIEGTHNHPILVMDESGVIIWRRLSNIKEGDACCISRGMEIWNEKCNLTEDDGALVGYLLSDEALGGLPQTFSFTNTDMKIVSDFKKCLKSCFGAKATDNLKQYGIDYKLMRIAICSEVQKKYGLLAVKSPEKTIPQTIRCASKIVQSAFIRAYFDGDGTFQHDKMNMQFCSASLEMLRQLQLMLLNFGIYTYITSTSIYNKYYERDYYELEFSGVEVRSYARVIGFNSNKKSDKIQDTLKRGNYNVNTNIDTIPYQVSKIKALYATIDPSARTRATIKVFRDLLLDLCELTYARLSRILSVVEGLIESHGTDVVMSHSLIDSLSEIKKQHFIFSAAKKITHKYNRTYDFTLPKTHSFWSNGFISHNTSLAMRTIGMAQALELNCAWFDAENSFSPDLARLNRMDIKNTLFFSRTVGSGGKAKILNAAEVLNRIFNAVWTGAFSLLVLDSVAALMPERIVDLDFDPSKKGISELARDMSSQLPKIVSACAEKECTVIFINQVRMKPGDKYDPYDTPGGKALKFYSNQRISVNKVGGKSALIIQTLEDGAEDIVGHYARVYVKKNRRNQPCYDALEIPIYYKEYFPDNAKKCYDLARKLQVIKTNRGMLTWKNPDGEIIAQTEGESNLLQFLRDSGSERISYLAHCCVEIAHSEKNQKKKIPVKVPQGIAKLSEGYNVKAIDSKKEKTKAKTKKKAVIDDDLDLDE